MRSAPQSPAPATATASSYEMDFEPLQAFLLKNTTVYAYPRQRRRPRNSTNDVDSLKAIGQRLLYFLIFYAVLALFFVGYLNWYMYFQVCSFHMFHFELHKETQSNEFFAIHLH